MNICVLIPSFNEEKTVGWLVKSVLTLGYHVIVIDDGSKDQTASLAQEAGAEMIVNPVNLGKGASLRKAFRIIASRNYDAVIIMDGDGQHLPSDIIHFVDAYKKTKPGVVVGNRMLRPKGMPWIRWMTNKFMSKVLSQKCGQRIADSQCGFRLIDAGILRELNLETQNFEIESEMLLEASRYGYRIESVPIATVYEGQSSAIHPVKDTVRFFKFLFKKR